MALALNAVADRLRGGSGGGSPGVRTDDGSGPGALVTLPVDGRHLVAVLPVGVSPLSW